MKAFVLVVLATTSVWLTVEAHSSTLRRLNKADIQEGELCEEQNQCSEELVCRKVRRSYDARKFCFEPDSIDKISMSLKNNPLFYTFMAVGGYTLIFTSCYFCIRQNQNDEQKAKMDGEHCLKNCCCGMFCGVCVLGLMCLCSEGGQVPDMTGATSSHATENASQQATCEIVEQASTGVSTV